MKHTRPKRTNTRGSLLGGPRRSQIQRQEVDGGGRGGESVFHGHRGSAREDEKVLETDGGEGCGPPRMPLTLPNRTLNTG